MAETSNLSVFRIHDAQDGRNDAGNSGGFAEPACAVGGTRTFPRPRLPRSRQSHPPSRCRRNQHYYQRPHRCYASSRVLTQHTSYLSIRDTLTFYTVGRVVETAVQRTATSSRSCIPHARPERRVFARGVHNQGGGGHCGARRASSRRAAARCAARNAARRCGCEARRRAPYASAPSLEVVILHALDQFRLCSSRLCVTRARSAPDARVRPPLAARKLAYVAFAAAPQIA